MVGKRRIEPGDTGDVDRSRVADEIEAALAEREAPGAGGPPEGSVPVLAESSSPDASLPGRIGAWLIDAVGVWLAVELLARFDLHRSRAVRYLSDPGGGAARHRVVVLTEGPSATIVWILLAAVPVVWVVAVALTGRTLGKWALGHRVVRIDGARVGWRDSIVRNAVAIGPWLGLSALGLGWIGPIWGAVVLGSVALDRRRRGLHDHAAGTVVVRDRPLRFA